MWMRAISSSSFFGIWNPDLCCVSFAYVYNPPNSIIHTINQELRNRKEVSTTPFSLKAARGAPVDAVARMLADKAESFAEYYLHGAAPSRSINPDPCDFIRQKADDAREIAAALSRPVGFVALSMAANRLAKHCLEVGDFKMHDEMVALANSYVARAA